MPVTPLPGYRAELIHARSSSERPSRIAVTQSCPYANLAAGLKTVVDRAGQGQDQTPGPSGQNAEQPSATTSPFHTWRPG